MNRNQDPRKRTSSTLPAFPGSSNSKRERRSSSQSSASEDNSSPPKIHCRLCRNQVTCKNSEEFGFHLSLIHYRDRLFEAIGSPPYACRFCSFVPTAEDPNEEMIMHYGCKERLAIKYYQEDCISLPNIEIKAVDKCAVLVCQLCKHKCTNEKLFNLHITQKHYWQELRRRLPKEVPFRCPYKDCSHVKKDDYELVMHYGIEHGISKELYKRQTKSPDSNQQPHLKEVDLFKGPDSNAASSSVKKTITCTICKEKKTSFVTEKSLKYHVIMSHFFAKLMQEKIIKCPKCKMKFPAKNEFAKHFIELHFEGYIKEFLQRKRANPPNKKLLQSCLSEELPKKQPSLEEDSKPIPKAREMKTIHGVRPVAKASRVADDEHEPKAKNSPVVISSAGRRMIDRWKGTSIDGQKYEIEQLQKKMEDMEAEHKVALSKKAKDFERWISQKEKSIEDEAQKRLEIEGKLEESRVEVADLKKQLEQADKKVSGLGEVVVEQHTKCALIASEKKEIEKKLASQELLGKELLDFQSYIEKIKTDGKEVKAELAKKSEELNELVEAQDKERQDHDKSLAKLQKQLDALKAKFDKVVEEKKEKMAHIKEITKLHKELENDQKNQIARLTKEKAEMLKKEEQQPTLENSTLSKKVKALEAEKKDNESTIKLLESQRNALLDSLDRVQKILQGFESVIKDKNEKIQDVTTKLEEAEINLEEALEKLNQSKKSEKESKELQKQIKHLQSTLKEWENRQFANVKLISGLEKEKAALEKRLKEMTEQQSNLDSQTKNITEIKVLKDSKDKFEQDLAKTQALLKSKTSELNAKKHLLAQAESKIKDLEREIRLGKVSSNVVDPDDDETRIHIKMEPLEQVDTEDRQIVLNMPNQSDLITDDDDQDSPLGRLFHSTDSYDFADVDIEGLNSPPFSDSETSSSIPKKKPSSKVASKIVDVSDQYNEEEDDITCGICLCWDPPVSNAGDTARTYTTSWVGCDCGQWYHKQCTNRKRFTSAFSCKSVKRKCQKVQPSKSLNDTPAEILP